MTKRKAHIITREEWLLKAAAFIVPVIEARAGVTVPPYRVSCSFPSKGGTSPKKRVQGQCWAAMASADGHAEIFISPVDASAREVMEILAHELIHAALPMDGHNNTFGKAARSIGFTGPWTSTPTTPEFWEWVDPIIKKLPPYPHAKLNAVRAVAAPKPQKNRQMKCECMTCGYVARTSRKWLELLGAPICPADGHGQMSIEIKDG